MAQRIQLRRGTALSASESNTILADGEPAYDKTNNVLKIGDGVTPWNDLEQLGSSEVSFASLTGQPTDNDNLSEELSGKVSTTVTVNSHPLSSNVTVTASDVGLGNVNNTSDAEKPVSTLQATAIGALQSDINAHEELTNNPHGVTASQVGLGSVDNTSDVDKPVSTQQQTALNLKANISAVVGLQDLWIGAGAMWPKTTGGCAALAKSELATSLLNIQTLDFDQTTQEFAQFTISLPRNWNNGTITAKMYWTASAGSGTVQWGISGGAYSNDDALTVALGTAVTVDDTLIATNDLHITDITSAITLSGIPSDADFLGFQVSRNPASDTLTGDAKLLGVVITLTTDNGVAA